MNLSAILLAAAPLLIQPPPTPPLLNPSKDGPPCPEQGGQQITEVWLDSLKDCDCLWRFHMTASEIYEMIKALEIPDVFVTRTHSKFSVVEAFCLLCAQLCSARDLYALLMLYDRAQSAISEVVNELVVYLDEWWEHLLGCDSDHLLHPSQFLIYADAIHQQGATTRSVFIDCTIQCICHSSWFHHVAYNGHKKFHALRFQALMLPNGIITHLYGPFEGHCNDNYLLTESGLLEQLAQFAFWEDFDENVPHEEYTEEYTFQIFGDPAYEYGFGIVANTWPSLNAAWKMKMQVYSSPVGRYYRVGVLLTNFAQYF
ncbi:hypothetical protein L208DRAFT_1426958 [Tricholoma matsutake]|nr:hypothetical protein L208DRAFT_1426958 [Tricholoma matsutake 945]